MMRLSPSRFRDTTAAAAAAAAVLVIASLCGGCEADDRVDGPLDDALLVEAILGTGSPADTVFVGFVTPLEAETPPPPPEDLEVAIAATDSRPAATLEPIGGGRYLLPEGALPVLAGATYELAIGYRGGEVTALATVPEPPLDLTLSRDTVRRSRVTSPQDLLAQEPAVAVTASWGGAPGTSYVTTLTPLDVAAAPVVDFELPGGQQGSAGLGGGGALLGGGAQPSAATVLDIEPQRALSLYTGYELAVYAVGPEYVALYGEASAQGAGTLNEAPDNIEGGYGLFTAVSVVRDTIWVVPD